MGAGFSRILKGICAVVVACVGIALTVFSGGTFALALGSGLFTAGLFGLAQVIFNKDVTWGQFFKSMCKGFVIGAVSGLCSIGASSMVSTIANATGLNTVVVAAGFGSLTGLTTNGLSNILHGKNFFDNWQTSMVFGAIIGASCQSLVLGTQSKEAIAGISKLREVITDFIPGAAKVAEITGKVMKLLPNAQFSAEYMRAVWILATDLLAVRRREEVKASTDQPLGVPQEVQQTARPSTVPPGNQSNSGSGNDEGRPGLIDTMKILEQLTEEELEKIQEILAIQFAPPPPYEERAAPVNIEEPAVIVDDILDVTEEIGNVRLQERVVDEERIVEHPEVHQIDRVAREENLNNPQQIADVMQENPVQQHHHGIILPAQDNAQVMPNAPEAQPAQAVNTTSFPGETGAQVIKQPIRVTVPSKAPTPLHTTHLTAAERDIKRRMRGLMSPDQLITNENSLFECYKKQEQLAVLTEEERIQRVLNNVAIEVGEGGQRMGVRAGETGPSASSSGNTSHLEEGGNDKKSEQATLTSAENFTSTPLSDKQTIKIPKNPRQAVVFKMAYHCDEKKEYVITQEWPEFDYNVRVVGVLGVPGSGKTYAILRMLMNMGYSVTQRDAAVARLRMGINAYLLRNDRILIVECCDGLDFGSSDLPRLKDNETFNMGGTLLELLTFSLSSRLIFSYPFHSGKPEKAAEYLIAKLDLLVRMSSTYSLLTQKDIQVVLRTGPQSPRSVNSAAENLRRLLSSGSGHQLSTDLRQQLEYILGLCTLDAQILKNHEISGLSMNYSKESKRELLQLVNFVRTGTSTVEMNSSNLRRFTEELFEFMKKRDLPKKLVEFQNSEVKRKNRSAVSDDIENYLNNVSNYCNDMLRSDSVYKGCGERMVDYFKDFENRLKEVERGPEEERTGKMNQMIIQHMIDIGNQLLTFGSSHTGEVGLCERGIRLGLYGYLVFPQANLDNVSVNQASLRMGIEIGLLGHLRNPVVHGNYRESWILLALLARYGFRLRLLEFDFWTAIQPFLKVMSGDEELPHDKLLVYSDILLFLREMTNSSAASFLPKKMDFWNEINISVGHQTIAQIGFDFEADANENIDLACERLLQDSSRCVEEHEKFVELPLTWIEQSIYAEKYQRAPQDQKDHLLEVLTHRNFEIMHKCYAFHISKKVMKILPEICSSAYEYQAEGQEIMKHRLGIIANIAGSFKGNSEEITPLLKLNPVINFINGLIDRGLSDSERVPPYFSQMLNCCTHLVVAERNTSSLDPTELMPLLKELCNGRGDMDQLREKTRIEEIIKYIGFTRHEFLKAGLVTVLIREFLQREMAFSDVDEYIIALMNFLVSNHDLEPLSADQYICSRQQICAKVLGHMHDSVEILKDNDQGSQQKQSALTEIENCSSLLNRMIAIFHSPTASYKGKFFYGDSESSDRQLESQNWQKLGAVLGEIFSLPEFKADKNQEMVKEVLELMLNTASISGLSVADALQKRRQKIVHGKGQLPDTEVKVFQNNMDKLDISRNYELDDRYVTVAAHIAAGDKFDFIETRRVLRAKVTKIQKYVKEQKENEEKRKKWEEEQEERRRRQPIELVSIDNNHSERYRAMEKPTVRTVHAVKDVHLVSGNIRIAKTLSSDPLELIKLLRQEYPADRKGAMLAHFLLFYNDVEHREEEFTAVKKYVQKVLKDANFIPLRREKEGAKKLLRLKHFETVLLQFGYKETDGLLELKTETVQKVLFEFKHFLDCLTSANGSLLAVLDTSFTVVSVDAHDTAKSLLPEAFFGNKVDQNLTRSMSTSSIETLIQMRRENQKFPKQLDYTLVRVWKGTNCYQAVFRPQSSVGNVIESLVVSGVEFYELRIKSNGKKLEDSQISDALETIGFYCIEFVAQ